MLFKTLLESITMKDIEDYFSNIEDEKKYIKDYKRLYEELLSKDVEITDMQLFLVWQKDYFDANLYISVLGYDLKDREHYALDFMSRSRWLGCEVLEKSLNEFGNVTFVCECLAEMSFISFDEVDIEEEKRILEERVKEIKDGTVETIPAEEVFEELREKYGWEVHECTLDEDEERTRKVEEIRLFNESKLNEILEK